MPTLTSTQTATLAYRHDLNEDLSILRVRPDSGVAPDFVPGQYVTLGLPDRPPTGVVIDDEAGQAERLTRRVYSIASPASEHDHLEFFIVRIPDGRLTHQLWRLHVGDRLWVDGKAKGTLTIEDVGPNRDLVMVSTGTGIGPYMSILRTHRGQGRWRRFVMINGVRHVADLGYRDELLAIAREDPTVQYIPIVSREPDHGDRPGLRGHVQDVLEEETYRRLVGVPLDPEQCHVFLCGNPDMIQSVRPLLERFGFRTHSKRRPGNIHLERYW